MAASEWLRTFMAIYRTGSVSAGAAQRGLSQPAASQQLSLLERRVGLPLFTRTPQGVEPTRRGRQLHAEVADSLDRLEPVLVGIDRGAAATPDPTIRIGCAAESFAAVILARMAHDAPPVAARFGSDIELLELLEHGELDLAVTSTTPGRRSLSSTPIGTKRFVLVAPPSLAPPASLDSPSALGAWLVGQPWVAYSSELPLTRRFWLTAFDRPFGGDLRLVAPDLRVVVAAVAQGLGISLLPEFACGDVLAQGTAVELSPVGDVVATELWFACIRAADAARRPLHELIADLALAGDGRPPVRTDGSGPPQSAMPSTGRPSSR
jgi:DNA-binding transcriptional LysR family regulator